MSTNLKLLPFQEDGVDFLTSGFHRLLADDMGLGKTIQVIAALDRINSCSTIIICPATVKIHWARMIAKWSKMKNNIFIVTSGFALIPPQATVIIVNYELLLNPRIYKQIIARGEVMGYQAAVMDEAHYLKNQEAKRTKKVLGKNSFLVNTIYKWPLTGTPVLNRPEEIYMLLYTLAPECIAPYLTFNAFADRYCNRHRTRKCRKCGASLAFSDVVCPRCHSKSIQEEGFNTSGHSNMDELATRIEPFMLRRELKDVIQQLPPIVESVIELPLTAPVSLDDTHMATVARELALAKIPYAISYVTDMLEERDKIVVFAHHRTVLEELQVGLEAFGAVLCYGGMTAEQKQKSIDAFITNPNTRVILAQTAAGGTGVDGLQGVCNVAVFVEMDWSPGVMDQAIARLRRIGQEQDTVFAYYLAIPDSLDTIKDSVLSNKRSVINQLIKSKEVNYTMSDAQDQALLAVANALNSVAALLNEAINPLKALNGNGVPATPPAKPPASRPAPKAKATQPDPAVGTAAPAAEKPKVGEDAVRKALSQFIAATPDKEANREIINTQIWPKYDTTEFAKLDPTHYEAVLEDLAKGPAAYEDAGLGV